MGFVKDDLFPHGNTGFALLEAVESSGDMVMAAFVRHMAFVRDKLIPARHM